MKTILSELFKLNDDDTISNEQIVLYTALVMVAVAEIQVGNLRLAGVLKKLSTDFNVGLVELLQAELDEVQRVKHKLSVNIGNN